MPATIDIWIIRLLILWLLLGTGLPGAPGRSAPEDPSAHRFFTRTNMVLVDVQVRDRSGRRVQGLTAEDFVVLEEGIPQAVTYFEEVFIPLPPATPALVTTGPGTGDRSASPAVEPVPAVVPSPPPAAAGPTDRPMTGLERRLLILLFDTGSADIQSLRLMEEAGRDFVNTQLTPSDAVAVLVFNNGLQLLADLTTDRAELTRAMARLDSTNPEMDVSLPDEDADAGGDDAAYLADETELALFQTNQQLSAIQTIADTFRDVTGRKALIYFSAGMTSRGVENEQEMRWTTDLCNKANMSVYTVDARGLVALSPGGGAHRGVSGGTAVFSGRADLNQLAGLARSQEGLISLAEETGGIALVDDNDLAKIFRAAREDNSHYYLLGYQTPAAPSDGRFHRLKVNVRREDVTVIHRPGYTADKPYRSLSPEEREFRFAQLVMEDQPAADFRLAVAAEYFPQAGSQYEVPVLLSFEYAEMRRLSGAETLNLELVIAARDASGRTRSGVRDQLEIRPRDTGGDVRFVYQNLLLLDPGRYDLVAYVRDNRTGKVARASGGVELPVDPAVKASSVVLAAGWREPAEDRLFNIKSGKYVTMVENPLLVENRVLIPRVERRFTRQEALFVHLRLAGGEVSAAPPYRLVLYDASRTELFSSPPKAMALSATGQPQVNIRLPLQELAPGWYLVQIRIMAGTADTWYFERDFQILP
ncbi:MAG: VWA domain-containing protein [Acidobacteria bacterium]|nr:VWA domain-containing protein [Acidobacteriota bacterium]